MRTSSVIFCLFAVLFSLDSAFADDTFTHTAILAESNDYPTIHSCFLAISFVKEVRSKSLDVSSIELLKIEGLHDDFGRALDLIATESRFAKSYDGVPAWVSDAESDAEMIRGNLSEFKYCMALHKIALLESELSNLKMGVVK
ncbi:hypothetical protein [Litorimonas sp.]|uniref:hypothetical protein n=1 Tax=Litorimonas sp. TaxID=1892381 RepID=UPI003A89D5A4